MKLVATIREPELEDAEKHDGKTHMFLVKNREYKVDVELENEAGTPGEQQVKFDEDLVKARLLFWTDEMQEVQNVKEAPLTTRVRKDGACKVTMSIKIRVTSKNRDQTKFQLEFSAKALSAGEPSQPRMLYTHVGPITVVSRRHVVQRIIDKQNAEKNAEKGQDNENENVQVGMKRSRSDSCKKLGSDAMEEGKLQAHFANKLDDMHHLMREVHAVIAVAAGKGVYGVTGMVGTGDRDEERCAKRQRVCGVRSCAGGSSEGALAAGRAVGPPLPVAASRAERLLSLLQECTAEDASSIATLLRQSPRPRLAPTVSSVLGAALVQFHEEEHEMGCAGYLGFESAALAHPLQPMMHSELSCPDHALENDLRSEEHVWGPFGGI
eukprot:TRINITY_DN9815_c0_g1_i1.p2 TRINITY_DN9815_c0_g1~~TRINITY_DN9815_c0_g1_i1.p2  ORF type:complete len:381 (-),score=117.32 TRINITY_DN9815_c0_g1_i1:259-1401(-)